MNLKSKQDAELVNDLKYLVQRERDATLEILHHLREIESRHLYLERGYPSLFEWVVSVLGYSAGAAQSRIQSMRLLKTLPELEVKIQSGDLSLSVAAQAQTFFRKEDQRRKSEDAPKLTLENKREIAQSLIGASTRECEKKLAAISPELAHKEKLRAISEDKTLVQFVADSKLMEKLERLKGLMAHQNYEGRLDVLIEALADQALAKFDTKAKSTPAPESEKRSHPQTRSIPARLKRAIKSRDLGACTYKDPISGKICASKHALEFEHLQPFSMGGEHSLENLTLRCRSHNQHSSRKLGILRE